MTRNLVSSFRRSYNKLPLNEQKELKKRLLQIAYLGTVLSVTAIIYPFLGRDFRAIGVPSMIIVTYLFATYVAAR